MLEGLLERLLICWLKGCDISGQTVNSINDYCFLMKRLFKFISALPYKSQLLYAVLVIVLIPIIIMFNTLWAMRAFERDMRLLERNRTTLVLDSLVSYI